MIGEKRNFIRYKSQSDCELRVGEETYTGRLIDFADGAGVIINGVSDLVPGIKVNLRAYDPEVIFNGEVVWRKKIKEDLRIGLRRLDNFRGYLGDYPLSDILIGFQRSTKTGILEIKSNSIIKRVFFKSGDVIFATSSNIDDRLGVLLLKEGKITLEQYLKSTNVLQQTGKRLGKVLVDIGAITPKELFDVVRHQIEEIILSLFTILDGKFEFFEGPLASNEVITLRISAANLIYQGIKRINNFIYIEKMCPPIDSVLNISSNPMNIFQDIALDPADKEIFSLVNGRDSIREILSRSPTGDFETLRTIFTLLNIGLVNVKGKDEAPVNIAVEEIISEPDEPLTEVFLHEVEKIYAKCDAFGYYDILGVDRDASPEDINSAYYIVSKMFHPDRHFSQSTQDLKEKLTKIFFYIDRAYETLSDPKKRSEYDNVLSEEGASAAQDSVDAVDEQPAGRIEGQERDSEEIPGEETVNAASGGDFDIEPHDPEGNPEIQDEAAEELSLEDVEHEDTLTESAVSVPEAVEPDVTGDETEDPENNDMGVPEDSESGLESEDEVAESMAGEERPQERDYFNQETARGQVKTEPRGAVEETISEERVSGKEGEKDIVSQGIFDPDSAEPAIREEEPVLSATGAAPEGRGIEAKKRGPGKIWTYLPIIIVSIAVLFFAAYYKSTQPNASKTGITSYSAPEFQFPAFREEALGKLLSESKSSGPRLPVFREQAFQALLDGRSDKKK